MVEHSDVKDFLEYLDEEEQRKKEIEEEKKLGYFEKFERYMNNHD